MTDPDTDTKTVEARLEAIEAKLDRLVKLVDPDGDGKPQPDGTLAYYFKCLDGWTARVMEDTRLRAAVVAVLVVVAQSVVARVWPSAPPVVTSAIGAFSPATRALEPGVSPAPAPEQP